ncbi:ATP-binding protein [Paraclostridium sordellii]|uniref:ATP-binding protein n=1 Tax=Paraclostridium sordellii TaxID=1505 RepID=UPI0005E79728|nr:ATP-binding protein [Paeniclostridium sordellii]AUN12977.1 ATP-dependent protease [Paeniclostridium sordellii]MDU5019436.1 AAA family ATPase [Clostridiales bacterium]CEN91172.1 peptidase S16 with C-terminal Lon domain [[Clostridium] sordellii] [Paeniclostridium sordellii]
MFNLDKFKLDVSKLKYKFNLDYMNFNSTEDIEPEREIIGQERAVQALKFGLSMKRKGYNIYASGCSGTGRNSYTNMLINEVKGSSKNIKDWVYVYNFKNQNEPISLSFNCGNGKCFKNDIEDIVEKLKDEVPKIFSTKEYEYHNRLLMTELESNIQQIIDELNKVAMVKGFRFEVTERGLISIPIKEDGNILSEEEIGNLTPQEIKHIREEGIKLNQESKDFINQIKQCEDSYKEKLEELDKNVGKSLVGFYKSYLIDKYNGDKKVEAYINDLCEDVVKNISKFKVIGEDSPQNPMALLGIMGPKNDNKFFIRYYVNLLIDNSDCKEGMVINETNPTYYNLTGAVDYKNEIGSLTTNFMEIKPGSLHKANGGFIIINAKDLLTNPFSWECLKRSLKTEKITIESLNKQYGHLATSTLKPEPIGLDIKVILIGDAYIYNLLYSYDEDFKNLFKIVADFDIEINKNDENIYKIVKLISNQCSEGGLKHFDKKAIERVLEYSARLSDDQYKLTARFSKILDLIYEADAISNKDHKYVTEEDIQNAICQSNYRNNKYEEKLNEMFEDETLLIDLDGEKVGQINGLAVMGNGEYRFGKPSKITASTYKGRSGIINIEREIKKSGSIHDKGVLILSGYLGERYGKEKSLSISTSITFEQNYSGVDGDSASSTELYAIISSISKIPIKQYIAVTGSVSQKGEIQPIGGINEKIEGFFDVCKLKGLNGKQGVMMPIQNVKNLMLKDEVIEAVKNGQFNIYAISTIEEGLGILTGMDMEEIDRCVNKQLELYRKSEDKKDEK